MSEDRYPTLPVEGNEHSVIVEFKGRACRALFSFDPDTRKLTRRLMTDSLALQRENQLEHYLGKGPLANAESRAKTYFDQKFPGLSAKRKRARSK